MTSGEAAGDTEDSAIDIEDVAKWTETNLAASQNSRDSQVAPGFIVQLSDGECQKDQDANAVDISLWTYSPIPIIFSHGHEMLRHQV